MVIGSNYSLDKQTVGTPVTKKFLEQYSSLLTNLKKLFENSRSSPGCYNTFPYAVSRMKDFIISSGGMRAVELLAEYEKSASIGDHLQCRRLEKQILIECDTFKECWISMYN